MKGSLIFVSNEGKNIFELLKSKALKDGEITSYEKATEKCIKNGVDYFIYEIEGGTSGAFELLEKLCWGGYTFGRIKIKNEGLTKEFAIASNSEQVNLFENTYAKTYETEEFITAYNKSLLKSKDFADIRIIKDFFTKIGLYGNLLGYSYIFSAISKIKKRPELLNRITTELYPVLANEYGVSAVSVERNIRNAIEVAYNRGKIHVIANKNYGGNFSETEKPTNGEFLAFLYSLTES